MSKIALTPNASGTGVFTIAAPNSNTDRTLTLPDEAGTLDRLERAGNVLQVVYGSTSTEVYSSSTTYADTGLSASITPTSASSKILVTVNHNGVGSYNGSSYLDLKILRNSTNLIAIGYPAGYTGGSISYNAIGSVSGEYLDSPSTTSSVTYKTQFLSSVSGQQVVLQWGSGATSTITLMEIAA